MPIHRGVAFVVALALAGCLGPPADPSDSSSQGPGPQPVTIGFTASDCQNLILFQLLDFSAAQPFLPPGFRARDASELLGNPAVVGKTSMVIVALDCVISGQTERWRPAFLELFVEPPAVPEVNGTSRFDFYEVERYGDSNELGGALREAGWRLIPANITISITAPNGLPALGMGSVSDARGLLLSMTGSTPAPLNLDIGTLRFWQATPGGLGLFETMFPLEPGAGAASCTMRAGSTAATLAASTTCPPGTPLLASFPDLSFASRFVYLPGVKAR